MEVDRKLTLPAEQERQSAVDAEHKAAAENMCKSLKMTIQGINLAQ